MSGKMARFFLQKFVIFNMTPDSLYLHVSEEKWGTLEVASRYD